MDFSPQYTRHQVLRGARPDAEKQGKLFLFKSVTELRLTYQIKLLTYMAFKDQKKLIIKVPQQCKKHPMLAAFLRQHSKWVELERAK